MVTKSLHLRAIDKGTSIITVCMAGSISLRKRSYCFRRSTICICFSSILSIQKIRAIPSLKRNSPLIIAFILLFHLATRFHLFLRGDNGQLSIEILGGENHALGNNTFQLTGS